jgi:hypothetical protein
MTGGRHLKKIPYGKFALHNNTRRVKKDFARQLADDIFGNPQHFENFHEDLDHEAFRSTKHRMIKSWLENPAVFTNEIVSNGLSPATAAIGAVKKMLLYRREKRLDKDEARSIRRQQESYEKLCGAFKKAEIPWDEFKDGQGKALSAEQSRARIKAALGNRTLRSILDKATKAVETEHASFGAKSLDALASVCYARPAMKDLSEAILCLDFDTRTEEEQRRRATALEAATVQDAALLKTTADDDLDAEERKKFTQNITRIASGLNVDATEDEINDIIDEHEKQGSFMHRLGRVISGVLHKGHNDLKSDEFVEMLARGQAIPFQTQKPHTFGILTPGHQ